MAKKHNVEACMKGAEYWLWQKRQAFQQALKGLFYALDGGSVLSLAVAVHTYEESVDGRLRGDNGQFWRMIETRRLVDPMTPAALPKRRAIYARCAKNDVRMYPKPLTGQ